MFGKYKHTVDEKGRLFVPSKLREELGNTFYVTLGLDHCLSVYTESGWQAINTTRCRSFRRGRCVSCLPMPPNASPISRAAS